MNRYTVTFDDAYSVLNGPDGFVCVLGEPEDRTWTRDGADVVARLETLEFEIDRLSALLRRVINVEPFLGKDIPEKLRGDILAALSPAPESQVGGADSTQTRGGEVSKTTPSRAGTTGQADPALTIGTTSTSQACPECNGNGSVYVDGDGYDHECPACHGTGRAGGKR